MLWLTARRPKSQEALISRRSRKELRRVLPREREKTQDTRGSCRAHVGDVGGYAGGVEGKELTQKRGGSQEDTRESGGHRRNQEYSGSHEGTWGKPTGIGRQGMRESMEGTWKHARQRAK